MQEAGHVGTIFLIPCWLNVDLLLQLAIEEGRLDVKLVPTICSNNGEQGTCLREEIPHQSLCPLAV